MLPFSSLFPSPTPRSFCAANGYHRQVREAFMHRVAKEARSFLVASTQAIGSV
jgi:hypothetical protein